MSILFRCFLLFCIFPVTILAEDNNLSGIQKYEAGDFSGASTDFLKQYWESEDPAEKGFLLFNLGNSLVRENKYSGAYGAYLSSRKYAYNDPDLEYNLKMMREKIKDDLKDEITPASLSDYISFVFLYLTPKLLIILFGVFCCLSILFFLFVRNTVSKNTVLIVSLLFILISGAFAFVFKKSQETVSNWGCIVSEKASVYANPGEGNPEIFNLSYMSPVLVERTDMLATKDFQKEIWLFIRLSNNKRGWVRQSDLSIFW